MIFRPLATVPVGTFLSVDRLVFRLFLSASVVFFQCPVRDIISPVPSSFPRSVSSFDHALKEKELLRPAMSPCKITQWIFDLLASNPGCAMRPRKPPSTSLFRPSTYFFFVIPPQYAVFPHTISFFFYRNCVAVRPLPDFFLPVHCFPLTIFSPCLLSSSPFSSVTWCFLPTVPWVCAPRSASRPMAWNVLAPCLFCPLKLFFSTFLFFLSFLQLCGLFFRLFFPRRSTSSPPDCVPQN